MCTKLSKSMGLLHRLKHYLPEEIMKKLYYSMIILPYINYGIKSWHGASQSATSDVIILQKMLSGPYLIWIINLILTFTLKEILYFNVMKCTKLTYAVTSIKCSKL